MFYKYNEKFEPIKNEEFEYNGKRYVRLYLRAMNKQIILTNGTPANLSDYYWLEVSPIRWYYDIKSNILISKTILASGVRFCDNHLYFDNFKETDMYLFLNKYFIKDIIPSQNNEYKSVVDTKTYDTSGNNKASKGEKIDELCLQIEKLANYYYGNKDYIGEVHKLIEDYNIKIEKVRKKDISSNTEFNLSLDVLDVDFIYNKVTHDLNNLLNELKDYYEIHKGHIEMLEYTRKCTSILNEEDDDVSEVFFDDLVKIRDIVSPYIRDKSIFENIKELFKGYEIELIKCLKEEDSEVSEIKSLEEFKKDIASKMTPYLIKLNQETRNTDILNDIVERFKSLSQTIEKQNRNKHIMFWFDEIEKCKDAIKRNGNSKDIDNLNKLLNDNNFISDSVDVSINKVYTLYMKIFRIFLDITGREEINNKYDSYKSRF